MTRAALDYLFGWRWLLPPASRGDLRAVGFSGDERSFLESELGHGKGGEEGQGWIVNAQTAAPPSMPAAVQWVAVTGTARAVRSWRRHLIGGFPFHREYALLSAENPRLVVPLTRSGDTIRGLQLHRAGRVWARTALRVAGGLAWLGIQRPLRGRMLLIAERQRSRWPAGALCIELASQLPESAWDYALYLGTSDSRRKTTILPLGPLESPTLVKHACSPPARKALQWEAAALRKVRTSVLAGQCPRLKALVHRGENLALYQEYRPPRRVQRRVRERAVSAFLVALSLMGRHHRPLSAFLGELNLPPEGETIRPALRWLEKRAAAGASVHEHFSHGDFAPWNSHWTRQGLFVFDWEDSREHSLALGDAFYYALAPLLLVSRTFNTHQAAATAMTRGREMAGLCRFDSMDVQLQFILWLVSRVGSHRRITSILEAIQGSLT